MDKVFGYSKRSQWINSRIVEIQKQIQGMAANGMAIPLEWMRECVWLDDLLKDRDPCA